MPKASSPQAPFRQARIPRQAGHQVGEQVHLARQGAQGELVGEIRGRVEAGAAVVDGDEGQGGAPGQGRHGRVEGHGQGQAAETLAGQVRLETVGQLQGAPRGRVLVGGGQLQDPGRDRGEPAARCGRGPAA